MSEKEQQIQRKKSLNWDEKRRNISPEKSQHVDGKADEAPRFDVSTVEDERKARFFKILFFAVFFNVLNLLCIGNLHQELKQLEKETDTTILSEYPNFFKAVQALFAFNLLQLIFFAFLTYSTLKLQLTPFRVVFVLTALMLFGKFISSISYLTAEKGVQEEFKEKILEISDSEIDSCLDDDAFKCRTIFTWNFSYYETIIDLVFGTIFSIAMMYNQKKEKDELVKQALRVAPTTTENDKDIERVKPEKKNDSLSNNLNLDNQKLKKGDNIYQRKRTTKQKIETEQTPATEQIQQEAARQTDKNASENDEISDKISLGGAPDKKQALINRVVSIEADEENQQNHRLNEQLNSLHNDTQQNENIFQLNESMNDSKIMMKNQIESSNNFSADKNSILGDSQQPESIQPIKASNLRGRKQIKKIKILQEKVLEDLDQNDEQQ